MKRRDLLASLGGVVVWPYSTRAQTVNQRALPHVAILGSDFIGGYDFTSNVAPLLSEFDLFEGRDFRTEAVFATGHDEFAAELGKRPVAVIVVQGERTIKTAKDATGTIPIVMVADVDPVAHGLVKNLARPGSNITGVALPTDELVSKRVELLKELIPGLVRVGILTNPDDQGAESERMAVIGATSRVGLASELLPVRSVADLESAFALARQTGCGAIMVLPDRTIFGLNTRVAGLAAAVRLPTMYPNRLYVGRLSYMGYATEVREGLISYGPIPIEVRRRVANFVARILKGAKPGDLPVEQPADFELAINLKVARRLDLVVPESLLARAEVVIE